MFDTVGDPVGDVIKSQIDQIVRSKGKAPKVSKWLNAMARKILTSLPVPGANYSRVFVQVVLLSGGFGGNLYVKKKLKDNIGTWFTPALGDVELHCPEQQSR